VTKTASDPPETTCANYAQPFSSRTSGGRRPKEKQLIPTDLENAHEIRDDVGVVQMKHEAL